MGAVLLPERAALGRFELHVRGEVPAALSGSLVVPTSRRHKDRRRFARWHDSQTDLLRLDLHPGRPGRITATVLEVDPLGADLPRPLRDEAHELRTLAADPAYGYATQPNHGVNIAGGRVWATNLLFGAPLELDLATWQPTRVVRFVPLDPDAPRVSGTSHFAWSLDRRRAYFHQSRLCHGRDDRPPYADQLVLIELDVASGRHRTWRLRAPPDDAAPECHNFHSAFYYEEAGERFVGLLRTGAVLEALRAHDRPMDHTVHPMPPSTIWILRLDDAAAELQATLLPGLRALNGLALSHLDVDASSGDGFVLYANFKEADVAEETHGHNVYGEPPEEVAEHYAGMTVEPLSHGLVIRYERRRGATRVATFARPYEPAATSRGHSWLPVNIERSPTGRYLYCSYGGFRPRLLSRHVACAYPERLAPYDRIRYVPPLLMRHDAETLAPDWQRDRGHLSYAEPIAMAVVGDERGEFVCTFAPETGLRVYRGGQLGQMVCQAESSSLMHWDDTHFRPDPAHMQFIPR
jgi:hypothetical protein